MAYLCLVAFSNPEDMNGTELQKFQIGVQNFESLVRDGYLYVGHNEVHAPLVTISRYYFLFMSSATDAMTDFFY